MIDMLSTSPVLRSESFLAEKLRQCKKNCHAHVMETNSEKLILRERGDHE